MLRRVAIDLDLPEPRSTRFLRGGVLWVIALAAISQWDSNPPPSSVLWLLRLAALVLAIGQQERFQIDRDRDLVRVVWTVFGRTVLSLRRTRLCALRGVVITSSVSTSTSKYGEKTRSYLYRVELVGDFRFYVFPMDDVLPARALADRLAREYGVTIEDRTVL